MKFKILPKVDGFTDLQGIQHKPGDIVDLPERYAGLNWLEPVDKPKKPAAPAPAKAEPAVKVKASVPLVKAKATEKKSKS